MRTMQYKLDADEVARAVSVPQLLRHFGWKTRYRRANCGVCQRRHHTRWTVAFNEHEWHCHRGDCQAGGGVFQLIQAELRCDFVTALRYAADLAGIRPAAPETRAQMGESRKREELRREKEERNERVTDYLERRARELRNRVLEHLWFFEDAQRSASLSLKDEPENEQAWALLISADRLVRSFDTKYKFVAFGPARQRADYILHPSRRETITNELLERGGFRDDDGRWWEVG